MRKVYIKDRIIEGIRLGMFTSEQMSTYRTKYKLSKIDLTQQLSELEMDHMEIERAWVHKVKGK
jgi:hypothetical protein